MKEFETSFIEKVIDIMKNNELTEVTLEDDHASMVIKSGSFTPVIKEKEQPVEEVETVEVTEKTETIETVETVEEKKKLVPIISNMIGLYFSKPSPDEKPFVQVGDTVKEGQVVCIIETIKLMNKIPSNISGKVAEICIEDGNPVEYGQVIMYIEQD